MAKSTAPVVSALATIAARLGESSHSTTRSLHGEINKLHRRVEALDNAAKSRSPIDTPEGHALKIGKMALALDREITATLNRTGAIFGAGLDDVKRRIDEKLNLKPDPKWEALIAQRFGALDGKGKAAALDTLIDGKRGPEMAAILNAPTIVTGITEQQRSVYEQSFVSTHAAELVDEERHLNESFETAVAATSAAASLVKDLRNPYKLAAIERADAEARAASAAFDESLSGGPGA